MTIILYTLPVFTRAYALAPTPFPPITLTFGGLVYPSPLFVITISSKRPCFIEPIADVLFDCVLAPLHAIESPFTLKDAPVNTGYSFGQVKLEPLDEKNLHNFELDIFLVTIFLVIMCFFVLVSIGFASFANLFVSKGGIGIEKLDCMGGVSLNFSTIYFWRIQL